MFLISPFLENTQRPGQINVIDPIVVSATIVPIVHGYTSFFNEDLPLCCRPKIFFWLSAAPIRGFYLSCF